eukprot:CAMPEP_0119010762 /NCGR_PEP_ID=MMETSP1176-20130426/5230_1 /TAXON_ID=265551 /ORGANISM="Synedropsis recta cf, Strain CCMP1620" /LENGTH=194 /DNA_ID=CAMNT_0006963487 /DNA_START=72 /DNA_END=656 /DNA_ORIENTATION=+
MAFLNSLFNIFLWCIIIACIIQCCCRYKRRQEAIPPARDATGAENTTTRTAGDPPGTAPPTAVTSPNYVDPSLLRSSVLKAMFPEQKIEHNAQLRYDPESNSYQWTNNTTGDVSCSICLDNFEPGNTVISSSCSHCYHRDCIMAWLEIKDECPNCRQAMWDTEAYDMMEDEVRTMELAKRSKNRASTATESCSV